MRRPAQAPTLDAKAQDKTLPLKRRTLIGYGAAAAALSVGSSLVPAEAGAAPIAGSGVIQLIYQSNWQGAPWNATAIKLCQEFMDSTFNRDPHYKGLHVTVYPGGWGNATGVMAMALAGAPGTPDVIHSCCSDIAAYEGQNFLIPLNPYLRLDNIDPFQLFVRGHVEALMLGGTHYALPSYEGCPTMYYRQDILDELGLKYPETGWTYQDAEKLWRACTSVKGTTVRHGVSLYTGYEMEYLYKGWGGSEMDATHTKCLLDTPQCITAAEWLYDLIFSQVATYRTDSWGIMGAKPTTVFAMSGGWTLLPAAVHLGTSVKWDILPMPAWPSGFSATFDNIDFYGMLHTTKYPDKTWELLHWLTVEPHYTRFMMRVNLTGPALTSLWDEWETIIRSAPPPLRTKNIGAYREAALGGHAYPHLFFLNGPQQADAIVSTWQGKIANHQVSVAEGYAQAAKQVNAWEQEAGKFFAKQAAEFAAVKKVPVSPTSNYAAPSTTGIGVPFSKTPYIIEKNGVYTMLGDGWDCWEASDNTTFACIPVTATEGEWWCRVVLVSNLTCPHLSQWAKVGMMARGDLSDDAVEAYTHVTGGHNIEWQVRMIPGQTPSSQSGWTPSGLNGPALMKPNTQKHSNYLVKPVWLKLSRKGVWWTAWASWDGKHWTQTGTPGLAEMGGCWVGIMACSHNGSFGDKGYIRAVIDNVSFKPTHFVQLGNQGTPPAAGPVPANWATA